MNLGIKPESLTVYLTTGADFKTTLTMTGGWPAGTTLTLVLGSGTPVWTATISGTDATFDVDKASADAIANGTAVKLVYTNGTSDQIWATGSVVRT